jgi:hypothetical protein
MPAEIIGISQNMVLVWDPEPEDNTEILSLRTDLTDTWQDFELRKYL